ncbi:MAG: hypothetical protein K6F95_09580 [Selenomonas sp.]|uniref:hypothetical protein n=1 Tax=Selenomonas sp. TaxID=2053611 RepID=UPI0025D1C0D5|nr:hypothetical protein [Selenomonas sp.]MCR5758142.1 hypothetical protein [Selenomonas sp.]
MRYRWFADENKETDEYGVPVSRAEYDEALHPQKTPLYQPMEMLAIVVVASILAYEWLAGDNALVMFLCVSFLTYELRPLAKLCLGKNGDAVSNALTGFSIATFLGTLVWMFM